MAINSYSSHLYDLGTVSSADFPDEASAFAVAPAESLEFVPAGSLADAAGTDCPGFSCGLARILKH